MNPVFRSFAVVGLASSFASAFAQQWHVTDLGPAGQGSSAASINNQGVVSGYVGRGNAVRAATFSNGTTQFLGSLGGEYGSANAVSDNGLVVGTASVTDDPYVTHQFLYENGVMHDLGGFGANANAFDVNSSGVVVGDSKPAGDDYSYHATIYENGTLRDLGTPGWESHAYGINDAGTVIGWMQGPTLGYDHHAFRYDGSAMVDLGTLGGRWSAAYDLNETGQIVGESDAINGFQHPVLWENGAIHDLLAPGYHAGAAEAINAQGDILGWADDLSGKGHTVLYRGGEAVDVMANLDASGSGWLYLAAYDINDSGLMIGSGMKNGQYRALLFTPVVPEPASVAALGLGALGLVRRRKRG